MSAEHLDGLLARARESDDLIVFLTGAGISAESGIPTFRGEEGYWTVDAHNYHPQEMATWASFVRMLDNLPALGVPREAP